MKVIFQDFTKFFYVPNQQHGGCHQPSQQPFQHAGQAQAQGKKHRRTPKKPGCPSQCHGGGIIRPDIAGPLFQRDHQQRPADPQPEADIQHHADSRTGKPAAQNAQQVIDRPGPQPHSQAHDQPLGL